MSLRTRNKTVATFNLSSLADVIFLLLIFFMLTSRIVSQHAVKINRPTSEPTTITKPKATISVDQNANYFLDGQPIAFSSLASALQNILQGEEEAVVMLDMDKNLSVEKLVEIYDLASRLRIALILATDPKE